MVKENPKLDPDLKVYPYIDTVTTLTAFLMLQLQVDSTWKERAFFFFFFFLKKRRKKGPFLYFQLKTIALKFWTEAQQAENF